MQTHLSTTVAFIKKYNSGYIGYSNYKLKLKFKKMIQYNFVDTVFEIFK